MHPTHATQATPHPHPASAVRRLAPVVLALALVGAACSGSSSGSSDSTAKTGSTTTTTTTTTKAGGAGGPSGAKAQAFTDGDFYAVPDPLPPGPHGSLIRYQVITPSLFPDATTYRVMYRSESLEGDPIAVTGTAIVPTGAAPAEGRPILSNAHGTSGIADECAPSKDPGGELRLMGKQVEAGWLVAATDYEGLGTPGRHPYLVGESEGRSTIDAALAATELPDADAGDQLAISGYSQGGHAALWAGQVAATWAPDLRLVGTFAGAPATEMGLILGGAPSGFKLMMIAGFEAAFPEADPSLYLTPKGVGLLSAVDEGCTGDIFKAVAGIANGEIVRADRSKTGPWVTLPRANDPGRVATDAPVLIIHSDQDDTVPVALSQLLFARMCGLDQVVERRVLVGGGSHVGAAPEAFQQGLAWLDQRFQGTTEPVSTCPTP